MSNLPYFDDGPLLDRLRKRSKADRIKFHIRRVQRDKFVYQVMDMVTMSNIVDGIELQKRLDHLQDDIKQTEAHLKLAEDTQFQGLRKSLAKLVAKYLQSSERSHALLIKYLHNKKESTLQTLLVRLKKEEVWVDMCLGVELRIQDKCVAVEVSPATYIRISNVLDATRGDQMKHILKVNFGYSR